MNAKSIRLESLRLAAGLDPESVSALLSDAADIEGFIQGPSTSILHNRLDHIEKLLYNIQPKWEVVPEAEAKLEPYDETFSKGKVGARLATLVPAKYAGKPARKPRVVAKPPQKRTGARNK